MTSASCSVSVLSTCPSRSCLLCTVCSLTKFSGLWTMSVPVLLAHLHAFSFIVSSAERAVPILSFFVHIACLQAVPRRRAASPAGLIRSPFIHQAPKKTASSDQIPRVSRWHLLIPPGRRMYHAGMCQSPNAIVPFETLLRTIQALIAPPLVPIHHCAAERAKRFRSRHARPHHAHGSEQGARFDTNHDRHVRSLNLRGGEHNHLQY